MGGGGGVGGGARGGRQQVNDFDCHQSGLALGPGPRLGEVQAHRCYCMQPLGVACWWELIADSMRPCTACTHAPRAACPGQPLQRPSQPLLAPALAAQAARVAAQQRYLHVQGNAGQARLPWRAAVPLPARLRATGPPGTAVHSFGNFGTPAQARGCAVALTLHARVRLSGPGGCRTSCAGTQRLPLQSACTQRGLPCFGFLGKGTR